jgi:threonine dehydrogenase-like Zn-dependent dehydrogenase
LLLDLSDITPTGGSMHALWLENLSLSARADLPIPELESGEALVRVRLAGVCSTDLELLRGYYPFRGIPGHEFVGEVAAVAPDLEAASWVKSRVVGEINLACGNCDTCRRGHPTHCENRRVLGILNQDGAFAEYLTLPLKNLHQVPETVSDEQAVFTEPLAAALEIQQQVHILPTDRVLVIGAGRLGQLIAQTLALTACSLQVVARHPYQIELLKTRGIDVIDEEHVPSGKVDVVVEATGSPGGFQLARRAVRARGTLVLKSTYKDLVSLNLSSIVVDEITLIGSRCGPFPPALHLLETNQVDPIPLIQNTFALIDGVNALQEAGRPGQLKVLLRP